MLEYDTTRWHTSIFDGIFSCTLTLGYHSKTVHRLRFPTGLGQNIPIFEASQNSNSSTFCQCQNFASWPVLHKFRRLGLSQFNILRSSATGGLRVFQKFWYRQRVYSQCPSQGSYFNRQKSSISVETFTRLGQIAYSCCLPRLSPRDMSRESPVWT